MMPRPALAPRRRAAPRSAPRSVARSAVVPVAVLLFTAACGSSGAPAGDAGGPDGAADGSVTVFAAASLRASFTDLAARFEEAHPGADVRLNVAGSSDLVTQIIEGAPADVFAPADTASMDRVEAAGLLRGTAVDIATNTLRLAVPSDNPADIASLADAARPGVRTVVCAEQVPCGAAAARIEEAAGIDLDPVSEESSVTDVLGKVASGEADAGLVYATDIRAAGDTVLGIDVPEASDAVTTYPVAALADASDPATAQAFVDFVAGPDGRAVLGAAGFGAP
ncbi:molybdate ABC transporter substrate-binding protein [Arthrobacter agilis]|nr:molybdate ABC transporter substrate-binding protein [Arthrobacter agilis]